MFGYIVMNKPEIKFKDFDLYRSFYCGLCRELKSKYGISGQISLTYDMTFVVILLSALYEPHTQKGSTRCIIHPVCKQPVRRNTVTEYAADMNVLLTYYKCRDDWEDEKKVTALGYSKVLQGKVKKLDQKYPSYDKVAANVIGKDGGNWFTNFTIDKGSNDGIEVDMNVIAGSGLVGIVTDVGPNYAKVSAIINDTIKVSGMVTTTSDNLIVNGSLQNMNENMVIEFSNLNDKDNKVAIGDPVVTSYVSNRYQQGILIGYISTLTMDSNNLTKSGTITPAVDFEHIEEVLVILNKKQTAES